MPPDESGVVLVRLVRRAGIRAQYPLEVLDPDLDEEATHLHARRTVGEITGRLRIQLPSLDTGEPRLAPHGDAEWEPENYDRARVLDDERMLEVADREQLITVARELDSGVLVGFTRFLMDRSKPAVAHQWETLVVRAHRDAGADHVCIQVIDGTTDVPTAAWRQLSEALGLVKT